MASAVEICNLALSHIRAGSINSLTESSLAAQQCKLHYPILRDQCIEDAPWQFARSIKALALLSGVELFNWAFAYQYPSDCLRIDKLLLNWQTVTPGSTAASRVYDYGLPQPNLRGPVEYQIYNVSGNRVIAANEADLRIEYRCKVEDPNLFSRQFILALSHLLAAELAVPLVGVSEGRQLRADSLSLYDKYLSAAMAADLNEQWRPEPDSELITGRY